MVQANPGGDQEEIKDDSSECPSEQYSTNSDCEEPDPVVMALAEERQRQALIAAYTLGLQQRDRQPQP